jgi:hypothetical protein
MKAHQNNGSVFDLVGRVFLYFANDALHNMQSAANIGDQASEENHMRQALQHFKRVQVRSYYQSDEIHVAVISLCRARIRKPST